MDPARLRHMSICLIRYGVLASTKEFEPFGMDGPYNTHPLLMLAYDDTGVVRYIACQGSNVRPHYLELGWNRTANPRYTKSSSK